MPQQARVKRGQLDGATPDLQSHVTLETGRETGRHNGNEVRVSYGMNGGEKMGRCRKKLAAQPIPDEDVSINPTVSSR